MKFSSVFAMLAAAMTAVDALPTRRSSSSSISKRAVFTTSTYDELSISGGTAGGAAQAALAKLSGLPADLTTVERADLDFLDSVNSICNDAETDAFNPAIEAASGDAADALQVGDPIPFSCVGGPCIGFPRRDTICNDATRRNI
jgi:hypothetical protein